MQVEVLDLIRFFIGVTVLGYACYTDLKTRMAPNFLWLIMGGSGIVLLLIQYLSGNLEDLFPLIFVPIIIAIIYALYQVGLIFGGADAKAIMSLSLLTPFWPSLHGFPNHVSIMPFPWVIFSNSIIIFLLIPPSFLIYNALKGEIEFPFALLGYRMSIEEAKKRFVWPLEKVVDGKRKLILIPEDFDTTPLLEELEKKGLRRIWVTPKIPFMVPLLAGFIISYFHGDIIFSIADAFM